MNQMPASREGTIAVDALIRNATDALLKEQRADGHWVYELEADATIPAEYVLLVHYLAETPDLELERKIGVYLRRIQGEHGGWPLYHAGALDISATVKAYFALKMIGDDPNAPHMKHAREAVLKRGGADKANVFTRILLALYGQTSWKNVPTVPVELILLPRWFPIHLSKMSYWARTVIVPLLVLAAKKPLAKNPRGIEVCELFLPHGQVASKRAPHQKWHWSVFFGALDVLLKWFERFWPKKLRARAIGECVRWTTERLNGEDGLGAIYPAMANSVMMYDAMGVPPSDPRRAVARKSVEKLLVVKDDEAYCQPCVSPVWDTALVCHALMEAHDPKADAAVARALEWLKPLQVLDVKGDWEEERRGVRPGGWAFQYNNAYYPDLDDTAVVVMALDRAKESVAPKADYREAIARGREWVEGLQSKNGGWGAFDADNAYYYLNNIPFADHGALLDPPTEDVSGRCVGMLAQLGEGGERLKQGIAYLEKAQRADGSWFGRWGVNYIYGTWSALAGLNAAGLAPDHPAMRKAVGWLVAIQNEDGGWGEDCNSYKLDYSGYEAAPSTASQTAWALLGLMAAGEVDHPSVARGIAYLQSTQQADGLWGQEHYTGGGFPRVFYLRYHGYPRFFPLWAAARYRNLKAGNSRRVAYGL
jgi:squalene-hopene/tetraprenyl-beta-curcumene cyclase